MALGNGLVVPVLSGMASRHVHGRAQGRVLGLSAAAGSLGRFLGPALAAMPLPAGFSQWPRPLTGSMLSAVHNAYATAFTISAALLLAALAVIAIMRPLEIESPN
jgi:MFS family permease